jgi:succinate dehydrogenase / fumarate reductase flavoprotein subunit
VEAAAGTALEPFERAVNAQGESPYQVQYDLQEMMQELVGIVRTEDEMQRALKGLEKLWHRAGQVAAPANREFNPGWHTALDLKNLLTVSEAVTRAALERKESRGAQFREDYPNKDDAFGKVNTITWKAEDGTMQIRLEPLREMPEYLRQVIEEMK